MADTRPEALRTLRSATALRQLRTPLATAPRQAQLDLRAEMVVGLRWLWQQALVRHLAAITCLGNFVVAALQLLVIVLAKAQGVDEAQIA